jgi:glycosyltransferase involved in cell wall biosynthesis
VKNIRLPNKSKPLVTVAMVTYKSAPYVRMAIESVLASSYTNFELIISDDCSPDNTWEIICEFTDLRIRAYRNERNIGEYPNRKFCISEAKGIYSIFVDGDDLIYPNAIEEMVRSMEQFPKADLGISRPENEKYGTRPVYLTAHDTFELQYFTHDILGLSLARNIFRTAALQQMNAFPTNHINGDDFIRFQLAMENGIVVLKDNLVNWQSRTGQASEKLRGNIKGIILRYELNKTFLENRKAPIDQHQKIKAKRQMDIRFARQVLLILKRGEIVNSIQLYRRFKLPISAYLYGLGAILKLS